MKSIKTVFAGMLMVISLGSMYKTGEYVERMRHIDLTTYEWGVVMTELGPDWAVCFDPAPNTKMQECFTVPGNLYCEVK